jgi:hypothetical protein
MRWSANRKFIRNCSFSFGMTAYVVGVAPGWRDLETARGQPVPSPYSIRRQQWALSA